MSQAHKIKTAIGIFLLSMPLFLSAETTQSDFNDKDYVYIAPGTFLMGSNNGYLSEYPEHKVEISQGFYISKYEVTVREYLDFCKKTGKSIPKGLPNNTDAPAINISWHDAVEYCNWLSSSQGLTPLYTINSTSTECNFTGKGYRLPTEAEWEFAASTNKNGKKPVDKDGKVFKYSGSNSAENVAWLQSNSNGKPQPVGTKQANTRGIYDMTGNAAEWVWDKFKVNYYKNTPQKDPKGPENGNGHVIRGGHWDTEYAFRCRNSFRDYNEVNKENLHAGFRVVVSQ